MDAQRESLPSSLYPAQLRHRFQTLSPPSDAATDDKISQLLPSDNSVSENATASKSNASEGGEKARTEVEREIVADLECALCCGLLWRPVTLSCGHTFCCECIVRALDHQSCCPLCRVRVHLPSTPSINLVLQALIQKHCPQEFLKRAKEEEEQLASTTWMPIFVLNTVVFPGETLKLHVYENRYKLMIRRCLQGSREFGVMLFQVAHNSQSLEGHIGTIVKIVDHKLFPDGRFMLEVIGERRFFSDQISEMDGYSASKYSILEEFTESDNIETLKRYMTDIVAKLGPMGFGHYMANNPVFDSPDLLSEREVRKKAMEFSFWFAMTLHLDPDIKQDVRILNPKLHQTVTNPNLQPLPELLEVSSTERRLKMELDLVENYSKVLWCSIL